MTETEPFAGSGWIDPDDAPELSEDFFARAELRDGGRPLRHGRPPTGQAKQLLSLRVGPEWQTRAVEALGRFAAEAKEE
jgi:hypothetical protein